MLAETGIAVVKAQHPKARIGQSLNHGRRPGDQLHAQPHDEQHHRALRIARARVAVLNLEFNVVGFNFHRMIIYSLT